MAEETEMTEDEAVAAAEAAENGDNQVTTEEVDDTTAEDDTSGQKETKTLLSDDEGEGSDDVDPSSYEYTPAEGSQLSEEAQNMIDAFKEQAAEMKLSPEQFQALVDYDIKRGQEALAEQANAYQERIAQWGEQVKADKELGGDNLDSNLATIKKVADAYGDKDLMSLMKAPSADNPNGLGLGNNPAMLRFLHRVGKSLADSEIIEGDGFKTTDRDALRTMYPTMFQNAS